MTSGISQAWFRKAAAIDTNSINLEILHQ
jgi:hypothetical protein